MTVSTINTYDVGDVVTLGVVITVSNVATDPTTLTLRIIRGDGVEETPVPIGSLTQNGTGDYQYDYAITTSGTHHYRWEGTSPAPGAEENTFVVRESNFS